MPRVTVDGASIYYEVHGTSGDPTVLIHGSWVDHHNWDAVVPGLAQGLEVVTYDRRSHGGSSGPPRSRPVRDDAADLAGLLEAVNVYPVHVVGHSYGGAVALRLAIDRPEMVRSISIHEPPFVGLLEDDPATALEGGRLLAGARQIQDLVRNGQSEAAARGFVDAFSLEPGAWDRLPAEVRATFLRNAPLWCQEFDDRDATHPDPLGFRDLMFPVLLTSGHLSPPFFHRINEALAAGLRNAIVRTLPEVGHVPQLTQPHRYIGLLVTFLLERNVPGS